MEASSFDRTLARLQKLCAKAEYCRADVYRKALKALEGDAGEASRLVVSCDQDALSERLPDCWAEGETDGPAGDCG